MEPLLDAVEARIVGALVEKHLTTPDNYPLTLNALPPGAMLSWGLRSRRLRRPLATAGDDRGTLQGARMWQPRGSRGAPAGASPPRHSLHCCRY